MQVDPNAPSGPALEPSASFPESSGSVGSLGGRKVNVVCKHFKEFFRWIAKAGKTAAKVFGEMQADSCSVARLCRLGINAFSVIEYAIGRPGMFSRACSQFGNSEEIIYTISSGDQVKYFLSGEQKEKHILNSLGQGVLLAAGIGGFIVLLGDVALLSFSKIAEGIGSLPIFGMISKIGMSFGQIVSGTAALGFVFLAADTIRNLIHAKTVKEKVQSWIDLAWNISDFVLATYFAVGFTHIAATIVLGTIAAGLGISSFLYGHLTKDQPDGKSEIEKPLPPLINA